MFVLLTSYTLCIVPFLYEHVLGRHDDTKGTKTLCFSADNRNRTPYNEHANGRKGQLQVCGSHNRHTLCNTKQKFQLQKLKFSLKLQLLTLHFQPYLGIEVTIGLWQLAWYTLSHCSQDISLVSSPITRQTWQQRHFLHCHPARTPEIIMKWKLRFWHLKNDFYLAAGLNRRRSRDNASRTPNRKSNLPRPPKFYKYNKQKLERKIVSTISAGFFSKFLHSQSIATCPRWWVQNVVREMSSWKAPEAVAQGKW